MPATGFTKPKGDKTAHLATRKDRQPIALAGLLDHWVSIDKVERKETVVATAPRHSRYSSMNGCPCVLELEDIEAWLRASPDEAAALMRPVKDVLRERPLGKAINNVKNNGPELLAP